MAMQLSYVNETLKYVLSLYTVYCLGVFIVTQNSGMENDLKTSLINYYRILLFSAQTLGVRLLYHKAV